MKNQLNIFIAVSLLITTFAFFSGCNTEKKEQIRIAVTKASSNYINWLKKGDSTLVIVNMYPLDRDSALKELDRCSGLLVTGGEDVQPEYYGKESEKHLCTETDPPRDTLEMALIRKAFELKMPVLGICRGLDIRPDVGHRETLVLFAGAGRAFAEVLFALVKGELFSAIDTDVFAGPDFLACIV